LDKLSFDSLYLISFEKSRPPSNNSQTLQGTLANLATSAFVRTPPQLAERIVRALLSFPQGKATNVLDPTAGEGDLLLSCRDIPHARLYGVEISAERAAAAQGRLPRAEIVTCAFEGVSIPKASMSLVLANPPYFFQDGKRAEYRIIADASTLLVPGGLMVAIIPARSAWDGTMVNHWCRWYDRVRVWKFPDRRSPEEEGAFEDFTQICVIGTRRAEPRDPIPAEQRRLQGYRYHAPSAAISGKAARTPVGWERGAPPSALPDTPIADPYPVPEALSRPHIVVRHADESLLLAALERSGAHLTPTWQAATEWREEGLREPPVMPLSGEAHVAAEVLTGLLDGEIVSLPTETGEDVPHLLSAFVGHEWVALPIDDEEREKLRERGVVHVEARQWQDKPILGVLNLQTGETRYEQGEAVFPVLRPWLHTLAAQVIEKRQPLYRLDPADWEVRVVAQFGRDKQLPHAAFPGLSLAQQHRVYAMGRALDHNGRTAIQGEPGVGKTRLATATAARMAYQWRQRTGPLFCGNAAQPAWIRDLRRAWLKNPRTLALMGLAPVYDSASRRIVAYRRADGTEMRPEEVGPQALPVLVSTPKKVTKEYAAEVRAAWPEAEVVFIERHTDIPGFFQRCAVSASPAVIGILSHSLTRAFGREWQPVMREKRITQREPVLEPEEGLLPKLEPAYDERGVLVGYRWKRSGELYTRETSVSHFFCPDCGGEIKAIPGRLHEVEQCPNEGEGDGLLLRRAGPPQGEAEPEDDRYEPVTSRTWFTLKPRWCNCRADARNRVGPRNPLGRRRRRTPLWTQVRLAAAQRKHPQLSFVDWSQAMTKVQREAVVRARQANHADLAMLARGDEAVLARVVEAALAGRTVEQAHVSRLVAERPAFLGEEASRSEGLRDVARREPRVLERLVVDAEESFNVETLMFRAAWQSAFSAGVQKGKGTGGCTAVSLGRPLTMGKEPRQHQIQDGQIIRREPLPASFSPYDFLYRFYRGCVALAIIDESHNGRGRDTDIAHAHHQAMLAAQTRMLTSGTHYGGDVLGFYHYWYRFHSQFWQRLGLGWNDADKALERYGVIQEWSKEYESEARRGSGQTTVQVSTIPAPGLSAKLIPYLLEDLVYLTVLDVGAHMPPRIEIPEIVSMRDAEIEDALAQATDARRQAAHRLSVITRQHVDDANEEAHVEQERLRQEVQEAIEREQAVQGWADKRHLAAHYGRLMHDLDDLAKKRNTAARLAKGTVPRWFAALPCDRPFEVWQLKRDRWGDTTGRELLVSTEQLAWEHRYPLEQRLIALVQHERSEGRRVMLYVEQNDLRSMARRLEWALAELHPWTLPNSVAAEDRQRAILEAVQAGQNVVIVPYRRVNEGLNLQSAIDTIIWVEMALNLFMLDQASRRAWRLGKREEVRIYYVAYANTAGHAKLRKLGQQSGAAAAFAGEPARGALIEHAGAHTTTLARLSNLLEEGEEEGESDLLLCDETEIVQEEAALKAVFRRRADELQAALKAGRTFLGGLSDDLADRLARLLACPAAASVWDERPAARLVAPARNANSRSEQVHRIQGQQGKATGTLPAAPAVTAAVASSAGAQPAAPPAGVPRAVLETAMEASPTIGSRAEVIFGHHEHIALARVRSRSRGSRSWETPRRRVPVSVREIPSLTEAAMDASEQSQNGQVTTLSLWDWLTAPTATGNMPAPLPSTASCEPALPVRQSHLW